MCGKFPDRRLRFRGSGQQPPRTRPHARKYAIIAPGTLYNRPVFPATLVIPPNTTNAPAQMLREHHVEDLREFQECEAVHNALIQQVVKAVEPMYLKSLRNPVT